MPIMTNAEAFEYDFGIYATELWSMPEDKFLEWLNSACDMERPRDMVVRCKDCIKYVHDTCANFGIRISRNPNDYCSSGRNKHEPY